MILNEKGILKTFDLVIYPIDVTVVIGDMKDEVEKNYKPYEIGFDGFAPPTEDTPAITFQVLEKETNDYNIMVWIKDFDHCKGSHFCHEAGHAALEIFRYIGASVELDNQEPFTYLLGTVFRFINGAFYEYKEFLEAKKSKTIKKN